MLSKTVLYEAYNQVKSSKGAAGIDGQSLRRFSEKLEEELSNLLLELKGKYYKPLPVKRVTIPKGDGGERNLGIPAVRDRIVQQALRNLLEPIFDVGFHPSSYGYRKGRSCHQAINKASLFIRSYNRKWVVDLDLSKCFDTLDHALIIQQVRNKVVDGSILNLIRLFLESGVMIGAKTEATIVGSPQGGVISPLLANIYLDRYDQMMKDRKHRIVRYADDILVLCCSKSAAENALVVTKCYLETKLKLKVNQDKTHIVNSDDGVKFLGVEIYTDYTRIQRKKIETLKAKIKWLTRRSRIDKVNEIIKDLNPIIRGFVNYFKIANCKWIMISLIKWVRKRLRCIQLKQWKKPSRLHRRLKQLGYYPPFMGIKMSSWRSASCSLAHMAMPNKWFHNELQLFDPTKVDVGISAY
ncbi:group II intron reverse transcriptase/maturase [Francisellaceae bacterium]|nr:group II intron reverse transcriptase/maturase [Francisellaceae bacterium]